MKEKTIILMATILIVAIILVIAYQKGWLSKLGLRKTIDGSKGTPPVGCGERTMKRVASAREVKGRYGYVYEFNTPYRDIVNSIYNFNIGDKVKGIEIDRGIIAENAIRTIHNGVVVYIPKSYLNQKDELSNPIVGLAGVEDSCTIPVYDLPQMQGASEICFSADDLGLKNGDEIPLIQKIAYRAQGTKNWHYNRTANDRHCYVYNPNGNYPAL